VCIDIEVRQLGTYTAYPPLQLCLLLPCCCRLRTAGSHVGCQLLQLHMGQPKVQVERVEVPEGRWGQEAGVGFGLSGL
jgi:hypothetical protein